MKKKGKWYSGEPKINLVQEDFQRLKNYEERFNVWQGRQIELLNWSIGILSTINIAVIGYWISLSTGHKFSCLHLFCVPVSIISLILLLLSIIIVS
jgi:hypothetical protein